MSSTTYTYLQLFSTDCPPTDCPVWEIFRIFHRLSALGKLFKIYTIFYNFHVENSKNCVILILIWYSVFWLAQLLKSKVKNWVLFTEKHNFTQKRVTRMLYFCKIKTSKFGFPKKFSIFLSAFFHRLSGSPKKGHKKSGQSVENNCMYFRSQFRQCFEVRILKNKNYRNLSKLNF